MQHDTSGVQREETTSEESVAYRLLVETLCEDGWPVERLDERSTVRFFFSSQFGDLRCYAQIRQSEQQLLCYTLAPVKAPEEARLRVAEFLTRANYGLPIGNFEMNFRDGEVRYKSSLDFEGERLTGHLIRNTFYPAIYTMEEYLPGLLLVMFGNEAPELAIRAIEG